MLHVCQCRCGNLIIKKNIYFLISGTLHVALLMGKAGGPVQVHFFGQVTFHTSPALSHLHFSSPAGQPKPQQIEVEFKFQSPTLITGLDIGNFWSAR